MNWGTIGIQFLTIIGEFLFELYLFYFLITLKIKKKENFISKLLIGFLVVFACAFLLTIAYYYIGNTVIGRVIIYTSLFVLSIFHLKFCFEESLWTILLCSTFAYALQNLLYKASLTVWTFFQWHNFYRFFQSFMSFDVYYRIFYYLFLLVAYLLIYKFIIKKIYKSVSTSTLKYQFLLIGIIVLLITNILCSLEDVYFLEFMEKGENEFSTYTIYMLRQTGNLFSIVCCAIVIILIYQALDKDHLKQRIEYLQHTIRAAERQYEISRDTIEMINIKCHDIKYKIEASLNKSQSNDFEDIKDIISIYDSKIETGNKLLDVLFTEKSLYCEQNNITFSAMIDGRKLDFIEDGDLYCLFGNLMDNALEAVTKIENRDKRIINITVKSNGNILLVQSDNYFDGNVVFDDNGLPITSKEDKNYHGFGVQSIKLIVEKYNGVMTTYCNQDVFHLNILFHLK